MQFRPANDEDIAASKLWPRGVYGFVIVDADEKMSSNGNQMIELQVEISRRDGSKRVVKDYVLPKRPEKLMHAAVACGVGDKYKAGVLSADDFVGKTGSVKVSVQRSREWPAKNVVEDYIWQGL